MDTTTAKLLEQLANKLGTTSQYLWSILLKQAPIDATITLFQFLLVGVFGVVLYKLHQKFTKITDDRYSQNLYSKYEEALFIPMIISLIIFAILSVCCFFSIDEIINGYFNPQYWAFHKIIETVKN